MDKVLCLARTPYACTLFLDCDTYICGNIDEMFDLLDEYQLAVAHAPFRISPPDYRALHPFMDTIPVSFPQLNSGVILCKQSPATLTLWEVFASLHHRDWEYARNQGFTLVGDQPAFREALYHNQLQFATLPQEYNCRFYMPYTPDTVGFLGDPVKILHGRAPNLDTVEATLNHISGPRVHILRRGVLKVQNGSGVKVTTRLWWHKPRIILKMQRLVHTLREEGIAAVVSKIKHKLLKP